MSELRRTALYHTHAALGAKLVPFAGWEMPLRYSGDKDEVAAVRTGAGLFDVSHMGQVELRGPQVAQEINRLITNNVALAPVGQATYTMMCNEQGGVIDDLIVYKLGDQHWFIVVNASRIEVDVAWMREHLSSDTELTLVSGRGLLAVQGPHALSTLQPLVDRELAQVAHNEIAEMAVLEVPCRLARTGYTGEDGFELVVPDDHLERVWNALLQSGARPCGLGARDVCRLEAGLRLYGNDLTEEVSPLEAGLKWTVKFEKPDFIGKAALRRQLEEGAPRKTVALKMLDRAIPRHGYPVAAEGNEVGEVTSGIFSPTLKVGIALARIWSEVPNTALFEVIVRGEPHPAEAVKLPFVKRS